MAGTTISTVVTNPVTLGSASYTSPLTIASTGTIAPTLAGATALYATLAAGIVLNQGSIIGAAGTGTGGDGLLLTAGYANNQGLLLGGYGTTLSGYGVAVSGSATLVNSAVINGNSSSVTFAGAVLLQGNAQLINSGTVTPALLSNGAGGNGVVFSDATGAALTNGAGGLIAGSSAIYADYTSATVVNAGTIDGNFSGVAGASSSTSPTNLVVTNTGVIEATGANAEGGIFFEGSATIVNGAPTDTTAQITGAAFGINIDPIGSTVLAATIVNYGTVSGGKNPGIELSQQANGTVINGSTVDSTAFINGILLDASYGNTGGLVENFGTDSGNGTFNAVYLSNGVLINGSASDTKALIISPAGYAAVNASTNTAIVNYGTISGHSSASGIFMESGVITNAASGTISAGKFGVYVDMYVGAGGVTLYNAGLIEARTGVWANLHYQYDFTVINTGTIASTLGNSGIAVEMGKGVNNRLVDMPGAAFVGTVTGGTRWDVLELGSATTVGTLSGFGSQFTEFTNLAFDPGAQWTAAGAYTGFDSGVTITGFAAGDTLVLDGFIANSHTYVRGLGLELGDGSSEITLRLEGPYTTDEFIVRPETNATDIVLCFLRGTFIATPRGEVEVEFLRVGDSVITSRGETRPITWIGVGHVLATRGRRNAATPVVVRKGALADNVPNRDLHVTKGHSLYLDGVLVPVEFLVNHRSILWDDQAQEVTVYHIELETHDVLLANGAPAESYRDDGNRWLFQNNNTGWDFPAKPPFAPVLTGGPLVDAIWRRLLDQAGSRPEVPLTDEPDLHLMIDGARLDATTRTGAVHVFHLRDIPEAIRLLSRCAAPQELGLARDPRCLGVAVQRLTVRQRTGFRTIQANDRVLAEGFYPFEAENGLRWTDGDAVLPASLFSGFTFPLELVVTLAGTTRYIDDGPACQAA